MVGDRLIVATELSLPSLQPHSLRLPLTSGIFRYMTQAAVTDATPMREERLRRGLSQQALADLCARKGAPVTDSQLSKIERGLCLPNPMARVDLVQQPRDVLWVRLDYAAQQVLPVLLTEAPPVRGSAERLDHLPLQGSDSLGELVQLLADGQLPGEFGHISAALGQSGTLGSFQLGRVHTALNCFPAQPFDILRGHLITPAAVRSCAAIASTSPFMSSASTVRAAPAHTAVSGNGVFRDAHNLPASLRMIRQPLRIGLSLVTGRTSIVRSRVRPVVAAPDGPVCVLGCLRTG